MRYHVVINAFFDDWMKQADELYWFCESNCDMLEEAEAYILCKDKAVVEKSGQYIPSETVLLTAEEYSPEAILEVLCPLMQPEDVYLFQSGFSGAELSVRAAERLGGGSVVSVHGASLGETVLVKKMVYSNHMEGTFEMKKGPYCIALAKGLERGKPTKKAGRVKKEIPCPLNNTFLVTRKVQAEISKLGLEDAKLVIAAGRGIRSRENVKALEETAECLGGVLGASRPAVMNAWLPMDRLIGVSGTVIQPEICITAGVSGAAAFSAGIEKSGFIIAINVDEKAPIMKKADVAVVGDFQPILHAIKELAVK